MSTDSQDPEDFLSPAIRPPGSIERTADIAAFVSEIGGAVASATGTPLGLAGGVISLALAYFVGGYASGRKFDRYTEAVGVINKRVTTLEGGVAAFVRTDDFADLFEETFDRIGRERHQDKRKMYATFLADKMLQPDTIYDEDLRLLQVIDQIGYAHLEIIRELLSRFPLKPPIRKPNQAVFDYLSDKYAAWFKGPKEEAFADLQNWRILDPHLSMPLDMVQSGRSLFTERGERLIDLLSD